MYQVIILTGSPHDPFLDVPRIPTLGAFKCAHALRSNGFSCLVINHLPAYSIDEMNELLDLAVSDETLMIGVSSTFLLPERSWNEPSPLRAASYLTNKTIVDKYMPNKVGFDEQVLHKLRNKFPKLKFILGGFKTAPDRETVGLDFMCLGYSEISIVNVAKHLLNGDEIPDSRKNVFGTVVVDDPTAKLYDFYNEVMRWLPEDVVTHTKLPIETGRGCIFNCDFCHHPMRGKKKLDYIKSADGLQKELMDNYKKYGVTSYTIVDDTFNDSVEKLIAIRDMVRTLPFQPEFWCYARLDLIAVRPETMEMLYEIGIRSVFFGIETLNQKTAAAISKGFNREKLISTAQMIRDKYPKVITSGGFIVGAPYESIESVMETQRMLFSGEFPLDSWIATPLQIWRGTSNNHPHSVTAWRSKFDLNWQKYGYSEIDNPPDDLVIYWKNDEMDFFKATEISCKIWVPKITNERGTFDRHLMMKAWAEDETRTTFMPRYKQKLLEIVKTKKRGISSVVERNVANV